MKEILFILIYLCVASVIIFGFNIIIKAINLSKQYLNYANKNSSKVRDYAVIIVCICAVITMIIAIVMISKMK